jgi:hypothetical protein
MKARGTVGMLITIAGTFSFKSGIGSGDMKGILQSIQKQMITAMLLLFINMI